MPRRLVVTVLVCALCAGLTGGAARADAGRLTGSVESPAQFVLPPPPPRPSLGARAVELARTQLGVPYAWGGASPAGFDCSGLVMWVYGRLGVSLPHNAAALYDAGRPVAPSELRPGDLLFFGGLGHVGLYVGHGRMIHAPRSGRSVEVQALAERGESLVGARRVTPA